MQTKPLKHLQSGMTPSKGSSMVNGVYLTMPSSNVVSKRPKGVHCINKLGSQQLRTARSALSKSDQKLECRQQCKHHHPSRRKLSVHALGFDFGDDERDSRLAPTPPRPSPKAFSVFTLRANSLLVYQHVFKGAVGEALLALLAVTAKYQASNKDIVAAYGKFYQLLLLSGYDDWQDYVLDQILLGRDNHFARAVAVGQVQQGAPILQAVAYDLDTLQGLAVSLTMLAEYVGELAPTAGSYWVSAASATACKRSSKQITPLGQAQSAIVLPAVDGGQQPGSSSSSAFGSSKDKADFIGPPATADELAQWKAVLAGHDHWSAAVSLLQHYYHQHGYGITSRTSTLRWSKGGFEEVSQGGLAIQEGQNPTNALSPARVAGPSHQNVLTALKGPYGQLAENTKGHCAGLPAQHAIVCGPPGAGKSWLLWEGTLLAGRDAGVRLVQIPNSELPNTVDIAKGCARYPRVRFILVADNVELPLRGPASAELVAGLEGSGAAGWPSNTLLYIGVSAASTVTRSDPIASCCPLLVTIDGLDNEPAYMQAIGEMLNLNQPMGKAASAAATAAGGPAASTKAAAAAAQTTPTAVTQTAGDTAAVIHNKDAGTSSVAASPLSTELTQAALQWGRQQGWSLRSAAAFARSVDC